jgi:hypothetical protein
MKINDSSDEINSLYHDALWLTDADTSGFSVTNFIRSANFALDHVVRKVLTVNGRWQFDDSNNTTLPIAKTDLVAGQEQYVFADSHLKVTRVRVKDVQGKWWTLAPKDRRDFDDATLEEVGQPLYYDKIGRSIMMYPIPSHGATAGVELTYQRGSNYFAVNDTTKEPGIDSLYHRYISLLPAREYAMKYNPERLNLIDAEIQRLDVELKEHFATRDVDDAPFMSIQRTTEFY